MMSKFEKLQFWLLDGRRLTIFFPDGAWGRPLDIIYYPKIIEPLPDAFYVEFENGVSLKIADAGNLEIKFEGKRAFVSGFLDLVVYFPESNAKVYTDGVLEFLDMKLPQWNE